MVSHSRREVMREVILILCFFLFIHFSSSQYPGARDSSVSWIDSTGSLWLFGGLRRYDSLNTEGEYIKIE